MPHFDLFLSKLTIQSIFSFPMNVVPIVYVIYYFITLRFGLRLGFYCIPSNQLYYSKITFTSNKTFLKNRNTWSLSFSIKTLRNFIVYVYWLLFTQLKSFINWRVLSLQPMFCWPQSHESKKNIIFLDFRIKCYELIWFWKYVSPNYKG